MSNKNKSPLPEIYKFLSKTLPKISAPVIFELGLHRGVDTERIFNLCTSPEYHGFEPDPRNISAFKKKDIYTKITFVEKAVANYDGNGTLNQSSGTPEHHNRQNNASSSLHKPKEHLKRWPWVKFETQVEAPVCKLDTYCDTNSINSIDFIWCDIQGGEYYMILGAQKILRKTKYIFMEYEDTALYEGHKMLPQIMKALPGKWEVLKKYPADVLLKNTEI
jgi:FkbM family methyltransferase